MERTFQSEDLALSEAQDVGLKEWLCSGCYTQCSGGGGGPAVVWNEMGRQARAAHMQAHFVLKA